MKIKGRKKSIRNKGTVTLPRSDGDDIVLTVYAMPPDYGDELERELPTPKPEWKGFARNRKGGIEFDKGGQPIKMYLDTDPDYLAKLRTIGQLQTVKIAYDGLDPEEVTFETKREGLEPIPFYQAVRQEMKSFGVSAGDLEAIAKAVSDVSNVNMERVLEARMDFFGEGSLPPSTQSTPSASDNTGATNKSGGDSPIENEPAGLPS